MTALPPGSDFTDDTITDADMKSALTALRAFLAGLLDDTGVPADALAALTGTAVTVNSHDLSTGIHPKKRFTGFRISPTISSKAAD